MSKLIDITGQRFGQLTALEYLGNQKWRCKCDCGNYTIVASSNLRKGHARSCGCIKITADLTGQRFERLIALRRVKTNSKGPNWICRCDCGNTVICRSDVLKSGNVRSCGCIRKDIGMPSEIMAEFIDGTQLSKIQSRPTAANKSGVVGVNWDKSRGKWQASIRFRGVKHHLGRFANKEDAIAARKAAEKKYFEPYREKENEI